jgi:hypothetical protein
MSARVRRTLTDVLPPIQEVVAATAGTVLGGIILALFAAAVGLIELSLAQVLIAAAVLLTAVGTGLTVRRQLGRQQEKRGAQLVREWQHEALTNTEFAVAWHRLYGVDPGNVQNLSDSERQQLERTVTAGMQRIQERLKD